MCIVTYMPCEPHKHNIYEEVKITWLNIIILTISFRRNLIDLKELKEKKLQSWLTSFTNV